MVSRWCEENERVVIWRSGRASVPHEYIRFAAEINTHKYNRMGGITLV